MSNGKLIPETAVCVLSADEQGRKNSQCQSNTEITLKKVGIAADIENAKPLAVDIHKNIGKAASAKHQAADQPKDLASPKA